MLCGKILSRYSVCRKWFLYEEARVVLWVRYYISKQICNFRLSYSDVVCYVCVTLYAVQPHVPPSFWCWVLDVFWRSATYSSSPVRYEWQYCEISKGRKDDRQSGQEVVRYQWKHAWAIRSCAVQRECHYEMQSQSRKGNRGEIWHIYPLWKHFFKTRIVDRIATQSNPINTFKIQIACSPISNNYMYQGKFIFKVPDFGIFLLFFFYLQQ